MTADERAALERQFLGAVEAIQTDLGFVIEMHAAAGRAAATHALIQVLGDLLVGQDARLRADALFKLEQLAVYVAATGPAQ